MNNPFAQFVDVENDPIVQPASTPRQDAADNRADRSLQIQEQNAAIQQQLAQFQIAEEREKQREREEQEAAATNADEAARSKLIATIGKISQAGLDANDNSGWLETGTSGSMARSVLPKGTAGYSLKKDLETVESRFAFDALQAMRDASKTGGALGQVTERELDLLKAATAAIDPDMDHETFMRNVEEARQAYLSKLAMIDPDAASRMGYDASLAESAWNKYNDRYAKELGYDTARPAVDRTPGTQSTAPLPDDIEAIMQKYGG